MTKLIGGLTYREARKNQFRKYVYDYKVIKRGLLLDKMNCSNSSFSHEYLEWLDSIPEIRYTKKTREFMWIGHTASKQESL